MIQLRSMYKPGILTKYRWYWLCWYQVYSTLWWTVKHRRCRLGNSYCDWVSRTFSQTVPGKRRKSPRILPTVCETVAVVVGVAAAAGVVAAAVAVFDQALFFVLVSAEDVVVAAGYPCCYSCWYIASRTQMQMGWKRQVAAAPGFLLAIALQSLAGVLSANTIYLPIQENIAFRSLIAE